MSTISYRKFKNKTFILSLLDNKIKITEQTDKTQALIELKDHKDYIDQLWENFLPRKALPCGVVRSKYKRSKSYHLSFKMGEWRVYELNNNKFISCTVHTTKRRAVLEFNKL